MKRLLLILIAGLLVMAACEGGMESDNMLSSDASPQATLPALDATSTSNSSQHSLNAGEIDDNDQFAHYLSYRSSYPRYSSNVRDVDVRRRQIITVVDSDGLPVHDARVMIYEGQWLLVESRTYADGRTLFFPDAWSQSVRFEAIVQKNDIAVTFSMDIQSGPEWVVELSNVERQRDRLQLDVVFLLDATGSMADEILQLQENILRISSEIDDLPGDIDTRYGLVHYRDRGDAYITRHADFVRDVLEFQSALNSVEAAGGGDKSESLNAGLHEAVQDLSWRDEDTIKLIYLVADAPPHLDYANDYDYRDEMVAAAWQGIKIHPIASSGLTDNGEYIFRQIAQYTMGHFIFLTYKQGTAGPAGTERTDLEAGRDGNYSVAQLDDLVLRLITDEIASLEQRVDNTDKQLQSVNTSLQPTNPIPADITLASLSSDSTQAGFVIVDNEIVNKPGILIMVLMVGVGAVISTGFILLTGRGKRKKSKRTLRDPGIYE